MKTPSLPETDSIEELARFWDTHEITDLESRLEEVGEPVFDRKRESAVVLRLTPEEVQALEEIARVRGVGQSDLIREWMLERLGSLRSGDPRDAKR